MENALRGSYTLGSRTKKAPHHDRGKWEMGTGLNGARLPGWAYRTRTAESGREPPNWICVTISPEVGASPAAETLRVRAAWRLRAGISRDCLSAPVYLQGPPGPMGYPVNVDECGRYFSSRTTEPDTGSLTPRSPSRTSSVSRNELRFAIISGRAAAKSAISAHSTIMQQVWSPVLIMLTFFKPVQLTSKVRCAWRNS